LFHLEIKLKSSNQSNNQFHVYVISQVQIWWLVKDIDTLPNNEPVDWLVSCWKNQIFNLKVRLITKQKNWHFWWSNTVVYLSAKIHFNYSMVLNQMFVLNYKWLLILKIKYVSFNKTYLLIIVNKVVRWLKYNK